MFHVLFYFFSYHKKKLLSFITSIIFRSGLQPSGGVRSFSPTLRIELNECAPAGLLQRLADQPSAFSGQTFGCLVV